MGWETNPVPEGGGTSGPGELETTLVSGSTTPSISAGIYFSIPSAVSITNFTNPPSSGVKRIRVRSEVAGSKIIHNNSLIKLPGGFDVDLDIDDFIWLYYDATNWVQDVLQQF